MIYEYYAVSPCPRANCFISLSFDMMTRLNFLISFNLKLPANLSLFPFPKIHLESLFLSNGPYYNIYNIINNLLKFPRKRNKLLSIVCNLSRIQFSTTYKKIKWRKEREAFFEYLVRRKETSSYFIQTKQYSRSISLAR